MIPIETINKKISLNKFLSFSLEVFWPLIILWIPVTLLFGFGGLLILLIGVFSVNSNIIGGAVFEISIALFPIPLLFLVYLINLRSKIVWMKVIVIYFCWCLFFLIPLFAFSAGLGGMVDGYVSNNSYLKRHLSYLCSAFWGVLYLQPIILILTWLGFYKLKKINRLYK